MKPHDARVGPQSPPGRAGHRHDGCAGKAGRSRSPARPRPPQNASGLASRATWSSTALTKLGSFPSGKRARATSTYSLITTLGGAAPSIRARRLPRGNSARSVGSIRLIGHFATSARSVIWSIFACQFTASASVFSKKRRIALGHLLALVDRAETMGLELARHVLQRLARGLHLEQRLHGIKPRRPSASAAFPRGWGPWVAARWGGLSHAVEGPSLSPATWITSGRGLESDAALRLPEAPRQRDQVQRRRRSAPRPCSAAPHRPVPRPVRGVSDRDDPVCRCRRPASPAAVNARLLSLTTTS